MYTMSFIRKIKKGPHVYLALVENKRVEGRVVQKVIRYIGKEIEGQVQKRVVTTDVQVESVRHYADVLAVHKVAQYLGLEELFGEVGKYILAFVYSHLLERPSIRKLEEWFNGTEIPQLLGLEEVSTGRLYETLGRVSEMDFGRVEEWIFNKLRSFESDGLSAIIDVTDTYFEGSTLEERPRRGKDGKYRKLIQIGLGVSGEHGFPIMIRTYPGNTSNLMIFKDLFVRLLEEGFKAVIIDRGMSSEENIKKVLQAKMRLICGVKKSSGLRERFLTKIKREVLYRMENRVKLQNTSVYIQEFPYQRGKMIVVYNPSLEVVKREIVYEENGTDEEARDVGYSLIFHNTDLSASEVTRKYFEKEIVDRAFKKIKGALSLRPIRVWRKEHIEGHIRICYLAYAILSFLEYFVKKFDLSAMEFLEKLKRGYRVYLKDLKSGFRWQTDVHLEKRLQRIIDSLNASL
jgi:hypothetical protein